MTEAHNKNNGNKLEEIKWNIKSPVCNKQMWEEEILDYKYIKFGIRSRVY